MLFIAKVADMVDSGPLSLRSCDTAIIPASNDLMNSDDEARSLDKNRKEQYHNIVAKGIFVATRSRPLLY